MVSNNRFNEIINAELHESPVEVQFAYSWSVITDWEWCILHSLESIVLSVVIISVILRHAWQKLFPLG